MAPETSPGAFAAVSWATAVARSPCLYSTADANVASAADNFAVTNALLEKSQLSINSTLEQKKKKLADERDAKVKEMESQGKSQSEIEALKSEYNAKIASILPNFSNLGQSILSKNSELLKSFNLASAEKTKAGFAKIFADNNYLSALHSQFSDWLSLGRMQQGYDVAQAQAQNKGLNYLG